MIFQYIVFSQYLSIYIMLCPYFHINTIHTSYQNIFILLCPSGHNMAYIRAKKRNGKTYYYLVEGVREGNKVRQKVLQYLGTSKEIKTPKKSIMLDELTVNNSLDYGSVIALHTLAERLNLSDTIYNATKKGGGIHIGKIIEIMVINRCIDPVSRNKLKDWYEKTALPIFLNIPPDKVHPQIFYNAMSYITDNAILRIQKELLKNVKKIYKIDTSQIFYDLTSTYFEGVKCPLGKFGHSTDHRPDKLQINIGLGVNKDCIPITHEVFCGSTRDVSTVQNFMSRLKSEFGIEGKIIVIDRGMISQDNLDYLVKLGYDYIVARRMGPNECDIIMSISDDEYAKEIIVNYSEEREIYLAKREINNKLLVICLNKKKAVDDKSFRDLMITRSSEKLKKIEKGCGNRNLNSKEQVYHAVYKVLEKYKTKKYFDIKINQRGAPRLKFKLIESELEKASRLDGKFILESSNLDIQPIEVMKGYHDRDVVEKFFQTLKDIVELRPIYVYKNNHVKAHIFICVLAVFFLSLIRKILKDAGKNITSIKVLEILDGIKRIEFSLNDGKAIIVRTTQFSNQQRDLISILNVAPIGL